MGGGKYSRSIPVRCMGSVMRFLAAATALVSFACGFEPTESEPPPETKTANVPAPSGLTLVPSALGSYDEMWAPLRQLESLYQPLATNSAKQMLETFHEGGGSAPAGTRNPQPMIISEQRQEGETLWLVFYTDHKLLRPETYLIEQPVADALESALYTEQVTGAAFNPYTTVSEKEVFNYSVNKLYLAGLIGYLTAKDAEPGRHWEAANTARKAGNLYETLHHALLSLSDGEEWSRCELPKIWAMWELDFPGSRDMAVEELSWFIGNGNDTAEARAMLEDFRASSESSS